MPTESESISTGQAATAAASERIATPSNPATGGDTLDAQASINAKVAALTAEVEELKSKNATTTHESIKRREKLKGAQEQLDDIAAQRDAAVVERDALKAEVERLKAVEASVTASEQRERDSLLFQMTEADKAIAATLPIGTLRAYHERLYMTPATPRATASADNGKATPAHEVIAGDPFVAIDKAIESNDPAAINAAFDAVLSRRR